MRTITRGRLVTRLAGAVVLGGAVLSLTSLASAAPAGLGATRGAVAPESSAVEQVQYRSGYCRALRRACIYKDVRGERGEGNCARYRAECTSGYRPFDRRWRNRDRDDD